MNAATTALNFLFPLITFPYISRILTPNGYGAAELALTTAQLFALLALLGANTYGLRECAKVRDDKAALAKTFQELLLILSIWTLIVTVVYYCLVFLVPRFSSSAVSFVVAGALIPLSVMGFQWFMSAVEQYAFMAIRNFIVKLLTICAMFLFVHSPEDIVIWVAISVLATGLSSIANVFFIFRTITIQKWCSLNWKRHIKPLVIFFLMVAATTIYTMLDTVMLGFMASDTDVGYYNIAVKIKNVFISLIAALAGVLIPRATYFLGTNNKNKYYQIVNLSTHAALIYSLFIVPVGIIFAEPIILVLAGDQYTPSISALLFIMPAVFFVSCTQITSSEILTPNNQEKKLALIYLSAGILNIGLNLVLIPSLRASGAAISTSLAELFVLIVQLVIIRKKEPLALYLKGSKEIVIWELIAFIILITGRLLLGSNIASAVITALCASLVLLVGLAHSKEPLINDFIISIKNYFIKWNNKEH